MLIAVAGLAVGTVVRSICALASAFSVADICDAPPSSFSATLLTSASLSAAIAASSVVLMYMRSALNVGAAACTCVRDSACVQKKLLTWVLRYSVDSCSSGATRLPLAISPGGA